MDKKGKTLGEKIKDARNEKGMSQRDLAKIVGVSHTAIGDLEKDKVKNVDLNMMADIISALDMPVFETLSMTNYGDVIFYINENTQIKNREKWDEKLQKEYYHHEKDKNNFDDVKRKLAKDGRSEVMKALNILQQRKLDEKNILNVIKLLYNIKSRFEAISKKGDISFEDFKKLTDMFEVDEEEAKF